MIIAVVGSGGKTSLIKELTEKYRAEGKTVFVTTTVHMLKEKNTICTDDAEIIVKQLNETGYAMAGTDNDIKITGLSKETYEVVCKHADVVLVEADGSKHMPLKFPNDTEPVIPDNAEEIMVVCGLHGMGKKAKECCHRLELVKACLDIDDETVITPTHVQELVKKGYMQPLAEMYPEKKITLVPRHDGTLYQRCIAAMMKQGVDVSIIQPEWFCPQPRLIICGGGHVSKEVAAMASHLDFHTRVIDDREDLMTGERFPVTEEVIYDSYDNLEMYLEAGAYYVIVTPDHKADYRCLSAILPTETAYVGMIGSKGKVANAKALLREDGFTEEQIQKLFAPIGLPIGAVTPAEIAFSILGQIIQEKNKKHSASADRKLLEVKESGVLCIITEKSGSAPRGVGSMMFVDDESFIGTIGGGSSENLAMEFARTVDKITMKDYTLDNRRDDGLDMVCGGRIKVLFIPLEK